MALVAELCAGGSLLDRLASAEDFMAEEQAQRLACELLAALLHLHEVGAAAGQSIHLLASARPSRATHCSRHPPSRSGLPSYYPPRLGGDTEIGSRVSRRLDAAGRRGGALVPAQGNNCCCFLSSQAWHTETSNQTTCSVPRPAVTLTSRATACSMVNSPA